MAITNGYHDYLEEQKALSIQAGARAQIVANQLTIIEKLHQVDDTYEKDEYIRDLKELFEVQMKDFKILYNTYSGKKYPY